MTVNKKFLANSIHENLNVSRQESARIVDVVFDTMAVNLQLGNDVELFGFGKFSVVEREARQGRNPKTGETVEIAARKQVKFKPSKVLSEMVNSEPEDAPVVEDNGF